MVNIVNCLHMIGLSNMLVYRQSKKKKTNKQTNKQKQTNTKKKRYNKLLISIRFMDYPQSVRKGLQYHLIYKPPLSINPVPVELLTTVETINITYTINID